MKHTQGKWSATTHPRQRVKYGAHKGEPCGRQGISIRTDADTNKNHICDVYGLDNKGSGWTSREEAIANANLIALAPEMLQELKMVALGLEHTDSDWAKERLEYVRETIASAEGK